MTQNLTEALNHLGNPGSLYKMEGPGRALAIGLISGVHTYLMSHEPGEGKTTLAWRFLSHLDIPDEEKVFISGYRGAGEEQVVGYPSPKAIREGRMDFLPGKSARTGKVVIIDEFDKMNRAAQESVLKIAASRRFSRAGFDQHCPLELLVGMGNAMPEERPVRDRFGLQYAIEPLSSDDKLEIMEWSAALDPPGASLIWGQIEEARILMGRVENLQPVLKSMIHELIGRFELTNRRVRVQLMPALRACAVLNGRSAITLQEIQEIAPLVCFHKGDITSTLQKELANEIGESIARLETELQERRLVKDVGAASDELSNALRDAQNASLESYEELAIAMGSAEVLQLIASKLSAAHGVRRAAEDLVNHTQVMTMKLFAARSAVAHKRKKRREESASQGEESSLEN